MEEEQVRKMKLGSQGLEISAQGLGCAGIARARKPDDEMIALIHHAINSGITFLDTADIYGPFIGETLLGKALKGVMREKVQLASKFGVKSVDGKIQVQGDPAYVRAACEASLKRLDVDYIDLYYQHRIDTKVPIEVTMGELKKLVDEGKIKYIGLSEASASTIRRAHAVHPITAVQLEWSLWTRDIEEEIVPTCRELGIGIVAYCPLGRGFFSLGPKVVENFYEGFSSIEYCRLVFLSRTTIYSISHTLGLPRFQPENLDHNKYVFERVSEMAARKGYTPSQLALAWVHHRGDDVCPIPGTTKLNNLDQNIKALSIKLTPDEMAELESCASVDKVKGERFMGKTYSWEDSETPALSSWQAQY